MRALATVILIGLTTSASADDPAPLKGTLCTITAKHAPACRPVEGSSVRITASDEERKFVWSSADGKQLVFGVIAPKSESIELTDKALRDVTLRVRGDR